MHNHIQKAGFLEQIKSSFDIHREDHIDVKDDIAVSL